MLKIFENREIKRIERELAAIEKVGSNCGIDLEFDTENYPWSCEETRRLKDRLFELMNH